MEGQFYVLSRRTVLGDVDVRKDSIARRKMHSSIKMAKFNHISANA